MLFRREGKMGYKYSSHLYELVIVCLISEKNRNFADIFNKTFPILQAMNPFSTLYIKSRNYLNNRRILTLT